MKTLLSIIIVLLGFNLHAQSDFLPEPANSLQLGMSLSELKEIIDMNGQSIVKYGREDQGIIISLDDKTIAEMTLVFSGMNKFKTLGRNPWIIGEGGDLTVEQLGNKGVLSMISFKMKKAKKTENYMTETYGPAQDSHTPNSPMSGPDYHGLWTKNADGKAYFIGANYEGGWFQVSTAPLIK